MNASLNSEITTLALFRTRFDTVVKILLVVLIHKSNRILLGLLRNYLPTYMSCNNEQNHEYSNRYLFIYITYKLNTSFYCFLYTYHSLDLTGRILIIPTPIKQFNTNSEIHLILLKLNQLQWLFLICYFKQVQRCLKTN